MTLLVLIPSSGKDADLARLAERSVRQADPTAKIVVMGGKGSHGGKLDFGRRLIDATTDIVVTLDSDCVVFPGWREWILRTLGKPVVACGAPRVDDEWGLHPSMMAMRAEHYEAAPSWKATDKDDTGEAVCRWLETRGYLAASPAHMTAGGWRGYGTPALWWHLGSGTESAWPGYPRHLYRVVRGWMGSARHAKAARRVARRQAFIESAAGILHARMLHGRPHNARMVEDHRP